MNTLLLDRTVWDLCKDASGNIAFATDPYAIAQDVASAVRLFLGELWYDTTKGVPYFQQILGRAFVPSLITARIERAALSVPQVVTASCTLTSLRDRTLSGEIIITFTPGSGVNVQPSPAGGLARAVILFVGDNGGVLTFVGDNGGVVTFFGPG
jgi:hypothetical protein